MSEDLQAAGSAYPPSEFTLVLRKPITDQAGGEIVELRLHEPTEDEWVKIGQYKDADHGDRRTARRFMVSLVAGVPMGAVAKMAIGDVATAEEYILAFFATGEAQRPWLPQSLPTYTAGARTPSDG
jgi:hypothetical protein